MGKWLWARLGAAALSVSMTSALSAATLLVNSSGQLTGATGVNVGGSLYDVTFVECDGSGTGSGCATTFTTAADAAAAAQALLTQVLIDGAAGNFDSHPELTFGCGDLISCTVAVPYNLTADTYAAFNFVSDANDSSGYAAFYWNGFTHGTTPLNYAVFAQFTPAAVPEASTWALMLLGFGAIGAAMRGRKQVVRARVAIAR